MMDWGMKGLATLVLVVLALLNLSPTPATAFSGYGSGTENDPYRITNVNQLQEIKDDRHAHYVLMNDIEAGQTYNWGEVPNYGFEPIGSQSGPFRGSLDGRGHIIKNLNIYRSEIPHVGIFGYVAQEAVIENLRLESLYVTNINKSSATATGGLAAINAGTIRWCSVEGFVYTEDMETGDGARQNTGGLVGINYGTITESYSDASVKGPSMVPNSSMGGLVGTNQGEITRSYSTARVRGDQTVGGLVGWNWEGSIVESYSAGEVSGTSGVGGLVGYNDDGAVENSFWDNESSGEDSSSGGTGKSTTEMRTESTFIAAGWDFENVWWMTEGETYPQLRSLSSPPPQEEGETGEVFLIWIGVGISVVVVAAVGFLLFRKY